MWVEVTARAEPLPDTATLRVEALMRDVTERKKLQDQARDLYLQLSQAEKLAALGQTMSGVAHELNNPLATILACAERLPSRRLDELTRRDLDAIHNAAERAARIVRNLQTFARKRHTTRTTVDLNQVVRETLALRAYEQRAANVVIIEALAAGLPPVFADPHQIQQIVLNLVINAEQAMIERARPRHADPPVVAGPGPRRGRARGQRRRPRRAGRSADEDLRSVLHDESGRQRHRSRTHGGLRDRAGTRRPDHGRLDAGTRRVVLPRTAGQRRARAAAGPGSGAHPA